MNQQRYDQLRKIVYDNYQHIADQFSMTRHKPFWPKLRQIIRELPIGGDLLDVGCGNGRLLEELKKRPINSYTGLDLSTNLLNIAMRRYPAASCPFTTIWKMGDLLDTPIDQRFDFIFCLATLHHLPGKDYRQQAVKNLTTWLKPGGYLIISVWNLWPQPRYWPKLIAGLGLALVGRLGYGDLLFNWGKQKKPGSQRYYHAFTTTELKKLITSTELQITAYYREDANYYLVARQPTKN
jgi:2-polyprenyl-3-methyl-5-hydroxy-6-metoxy-1,4-benzoquinol methylase